MSRTRPSVVGAALLASLALALPATADAVTTDLTWSLGQSTTTYGGGTQFSISSGGSAVDYRWLETLGKDTVISGNSCSDLSPYGVTSIPAGSTSYQRVFNGGPGLCFLVRGRVANGQGATTTRTGRISR